MKFLIDALVVWRITHLLQAEDGPYDAIFKFKVALKKQRMNLAFSLMTCFYCLSVWIGVLVALVRLGVHLDSVVYGIALSGAAILFQLISGDH